MARMRDWTAVFVLALGMGAVAALAQAQSQPQSTPTGQIDSMSMGQMGGMAWTTIWPTLRFLPVR